MTMRELMLLVEGMGSNAPAHLYHGTSDSAWKEIQETGFMVDRTDRPSGGVCFTDTKRVAEEFVRWSCERDYDESGVVLCFNGHAIARDFNLISFADDLDPAHRIPDEHEWRIADRPFGPVSKYLVTSYKAWRDSHDDPMEWGAGAEAWND